LICSSVDMSTSQNSIQLVSQASLHTFEYV